MTDERSEGILLRAMALTLALVYLGLFVYCIYKYVTTKDITAVTWELMLIVFIPFSITLFSRHDESLLIPKLSLSTEELPTETDQATVKLRKRYYFYDSILLAGVFLILTALDSHFIQSSWDFYPFIAGASDRTNIILSLIVDFFLSILIFYIISYLWDEWRVRRYKKKLEEMED